MAAKHRVISHTVASTVGLGGTFTVAYPAGTSAKDYHGGDDHQIVSHAGGTLFALSGDFSLTFGGANITVTILNGRSALVGGSKVFLHIDRAGILDDVQETAAVADNVTFLQTVKVDLGKPLAAVAAGIVASQAATLLSGLATGLNGSLAVAGVVSLDVPRNIVAAWTGAAVLTVIGTDQFGKALRESSASGTSFTGKKAFKTVTAITVSADVTALTVGTGNVLGLPFFLAEATEVRQELLDGAAAVAGTIVVGDGTSPATATTGDVRGTYVPNSAPDAARRFELVVIPREPAFKGQAQFA